MDAAEVAKHEVERQSRDVMLYFPHRCQNGAREVVAETWAIVPNCAGSLLQTFVVLRELDEKFSLTK